MSTPYITPQMLQNSSMGVDWKKILGNNFSPEEQLAAEVQLCWAATHETDAICGQPLRATIDTETLDGPSFRLSIKQSGNGRFLCSRWPILNIVSGQSGLASVFPRQWQPIPAANLDVETTSMGTYSSTVEGASGGGPSVIEIAPGVVNRSRSSNGIRVQITYENGWPHAGLTNSSVLAAGATSVPIDDCTGMIGARCMIYDGAVTEEVLVTAASATSGPGTVTLAVGTTYDHQAFPSGIVISSLPANVIRAVCMIAKSLSQTRISVTMSAQGIGGSMNNQGQQMSETLMQQAKEILKPYARKF